MSWRKAPCQLLAFQQTEMGRAGFAQAARALSGAAPYEAVAMYLSRGVEVVGGVCLWIGGRVGVWSGMFTIFIVG